MRRPAARLLALLFLAVVAFGVLGLLAPALATAGPVTNTASDHSRSFWSLLALVPWAVVAGWAASVVIPYLSALLTGHPGQLTGILTAVLALLDGFLATLAQQGSHLDLRAALAASAGSWAVASKWHTKVLSGTPAEAILHAVGRKAPGPVRDLTPTIHRPEHAAASPPTPIEDAPSVLAAPAIPPTTPDQATAWGQAGQQS